MEKLAKWIILVACFAVSGCGYVDTPPPPDDVLERGMIEALLDTGFYSNAVVNRTLGKHFDPSRRAWKIFACFDFKLVDGGQGSTCVDSFEALQLDNGTWVMAVTIDGVYRWRAIGSTGDSQGVPAVTGTSR